jgi:hypothetical protein
MAKQGLAASKAGQRMSYGQQYKPIVSYGMKGRQSCINACRTPGSATFDLSEQNLLARV